MKNQIQELQLVLKNNKLEVNEQNLEYQHIKDTNLKLATQVASLKEQLTVLNSNKPETLALNEKKNSLVKDRISIFTSKSEENCEKKLPFPVSPIIPMISNISNITTKEKDWQKLNETPPQLDNPLNDYKMNFLESSLEQLSSIQKQLVYQNTELKKNVSVAEKKLNARSERIKNLEKLLKETQSQLDLQLEQKIQEDESSLSMVEKQQAPLYGKIAKPLRGQGSWYVNIVKK